VRAFVLVWLVASGCDAGSCKAGAKTAMNTLADAAPGAVLTVALSDCSTCAHGHATGYWSKNNFGVSNTGTVEVQLSPGCFVQDITVEGNHLFCPTSSATPSM